MKPGSALVPLLVCLTSLATSGCLTSGANLSVPAVRRPDSTDPTLEQLAHAQPPAGHHALLVLYPRSAQSGSARAVFTDEKGTFYGAIAPGEGALLVIPDTQTTLYAFSSVEVTARTYEWAIVEAIRLPAPPDGLMLRSMSGGGGQHFTTRLATKPALEEAMGTVDVRWVEPKIEEGQRWLDAHPARINQLLGRRRPTPAAPIAQEVTLPVRGH